MKKGLEYILNSLAEVPREPLVVLMYHSVGGGVQGSISVQNFVRHVEFITKELACTVVDWNCNDKVGQVMNACPTVLFTFDDGYMDNFEFAAPILEDFGVRGIFFVTTGFIDQVFDITRTFRSYCGLRPMSWDHARLLQKRGHTIGVHGYTHRNFRTMSYAQAETEMRVSISRYTTIIGNSPTTFAYPFGQIQHQRSDFDDCFQSLGIDTVFTTENKRADLYEIRTKLASGVSYIPRVRVDSDDSEELLKKKLLGKWDYVAQIQRLRASFEMKSLKPIIRGKA